MVLPALALVGLWPGLPCRGEPAAAQNRFPGSALSAQRYVIDVTIDPVKFTLSARAGATFRCSKDLGSLELSLNPHLRLAAVHDSEGHELAWQRSNRAGSPRISIQLKNPCTAGTSVQLQFEYAGTVHPAPPFQPAPGHYFLRDDDFWYPQAGVFDFTENDFTIRVPAGCESLTSGKLVDEHREGSVAVYHWATAHAVNGRAIAVLARPKRAPAVQELQAMPGADKGGAGAPERVEEVCSDEIAALPGTARCGELARRALPVLQKFTALLGPPPESSLTILPLDNATEGIAGYSAPGMLVVSDWVARFADESAGTPGLLPHEIAHQWFPNGAAPASAGDGWLAESLAEYLAWRYLLEADPESARAMVAEAMRDAVAYTPARPLSLGLELLGGPWSAARAILYQRGMLVFRTLETVIDRERVDRALAEFYKRYEGQSASIADFRAVCERIAGRKLGWFFDYFIQGTEIPTIELRRLPSESPDIVAGEIAVKDFPPEGTVRVEMALRTTQGVVEHSVATRGAVTPFSANVSAPANGITLDPDQRILRWTEAAERSRAQSAILAALPDEFTAENMPAAIELYRRAIADDPDDASGRAQSLHERLGELEREKEEWKAALEDLEAGINGHSLSPFDTYLCRAKAYLFHGEVQLHQGQAQAALDDARSGLALPQLVLMEQVRVARARPGASLMLEQALESLRNRASGQ